MRIDSHQHFWSPARGDYTWLQGDDPALEPLRRAFLPADLEPLLAASGTSRTVLVQAADSVAETDFMLCLAARNDFIGGVVGWVDLSRSDAAATIEAWARFPKFKGVRPMLQDLPDTQWIAQAALTPAITAMQAHGLVFDALVLPKHLGPLLAFAQRHPDLPIVIDHAAKPEIALGRLDPWRQDMTTLAALPQVHCKLSGLLTEAGVHARASALEPYVAHLFATFGAERLIWGSDWPVLNLAAGYSGWLAMAQALCRGRPGMDDTRLAAIFGGNARRIYHLD